MKRLSVFGACWLSVVLWSSLAIAEESTSMTLLLAKRGMLLVDDDGVTDREGKVTVKLPNGLILRAGAGKWERSHESDGAWRSSWTAEMGHAPVVSYRGFRERDLVVEVSFRYGVMTEGWHTQCFRIALDQRPEITGHVLSAWANPNNDFLETGFLLQHIRKTPKKSVIQDLLLDRQPIAIEPERWYTAVVECVGDEALFRMGDHLAYAHSEEIARRKNLVSLTWGKTWHEVKRVRIWRAELDPGWEERKAEVLAKREPFAARSRE